MKTVVIISLGTSLFLAAALSLVGYTDYSSIALFFLSSLFFNFNLSLSFKKKTTEVTQILSFLFWMGFVFKPFVHMYVGHDFIEPAGQNPFQFINEALQVMVIIGASLTLLNVLTWWFVKNKSFVRVEKMKPSNMYFYSASILALVVYLINWKIGFLRVGLASAYLIPFPFSLLFSWLLGIGAIFLIYLFIQKPNIPKLSTAFAVLVIAVISVLSRNIIVLMMYPILRYAFQNFKFEFKIKKMLIIASVAFICVVSILTVTLLRKAFFSTQNMTLSQVFKQLVINQQTGGNINAEKKIMDQVKLENYDLTAMLLDRQIIEQISHVFVERWVGFEGLLVAVQNTSDQNFTEILFESQRDKPVSLYAQLSNTDWKVNSKYLFYSIPGPFSLIFFAESYWYRALSIMLYLCGVFIFSILTEMLFSGLARSAVAWWMAASLAQISLFFVQNFKIVIAYFVMCVATIYIIQYVMKKKRNEKIS